MIIEFNKHFFFKYDKYYRPRQKPEYALTDETLYDPLSEKTFHVSELSGFRIEPTDERFVLTAIDVACLTHDFYGALGMISDLLGKNPKDTHALYMKADTLRALGDKAQAMVYCNEAISIEENNAYALHCRATLHALNGDYEDALKDISKAIESSEVPHRLDYLVKSTVLDFMLREEEASDVLAKALAIKKEGFLANFHTSLLQYHAGDEDDYVSVIAGGPSFT